MTFIRSGTPARPLCHRRREMRSIRRGSWPMTSLPDDPQGLGEDDPVCQS